jgi:hypothetical protein
MDRTVPKTGSEEIELYMRTYYSLLRSTHTVQIETLVETHMAMESSLHVGARSPEPDAAARTMMVSTRWRCLSPAGRTSTTLFRC